MVAFATISFTVGPTDSIRVGTLNLDTGAITNWSPPCPPMHPFDAANQGTGLADGRCVFGTQFDSPTFLSFHILDAARTAWTTIETDVTLSDFDTLQAPLLDMGVDPDTGIDDVLVCYRGVDNKLRTLQVRVESGVSHAYTARVRQADDETVFHESPSMAGDGLWLSTTEGQYIYRISKNGLGGAWVDTGDSAGADIDLTAAAYHPTKESVFVLGLPLAANVRYASEYTYPGGVLLNSWGPTTVASDFATYSANGVATGDYYVTADSLTDHVSIFRPSSGTFSILPVVLPPELLAVGSAAQVLMVQSVVDVFPTPNLDGLFLNGDAYFSRGPA
jgi:hypothetical protein